EKRICRRLAGDTRSLKPSVTVTVGAVAIAAPPFRTIVPLGAVVSWTVTVNAPLRELPWLSVALQLTVVVPTGKPDPEAGVQTTETEPSARSLADAVHVTVVVGPVASTLIASGRASVGGVVSRTVTPNEPAALFPCTSVAEQLTVLVPTAKPEPETGVQTTDTEPSTRSSAVAVQETGVRRPIASTVMSGGSVRTGGVVSVTVTTN